MHIQNKGWGLAAPGFVILGFLILRPVMEATLGRNSPDFNLHSNATVLAFAGIASLALAAHLDKKAGIDVFSKYAWTRGFLESRHSILYLPLRAAGLLLVVINLFF